MTALSQFEQDWPAVSDLLEEALDVPDAQLDTWLAGLDGERARHRESLRALLAHRAQVESEDFLGDGPRLGSGAASASASASATGGLVAGADVGGYRLIREIGRGGMSTVWLAERSDGSLRRQVALKLPRIVWGDAFAERLLRERDILAGLEHEHIARLYDAGVDAHGRPFIAMAFVDGQPIDAYCRTHSLALRQRVGLLGQVMAAMTHAHARLVVHRDLKPGNIVVTREGRVQLLDFGIAKLLEGDSTRRTRLTEVAGRALTLDYASPEQIHGRPLGTGSDVYSMAVVAFEVLAGQRPYRLKRGTAAELEEAITTAEVPLASAVAVDPATKRALRGDLDAILAHALRKRPGDRYPTMDALAQDFARWLAGEPVQARPDAPGYRAMRFVGRHRWQVAAGAAVVAALVAGTSVATWQAARARTEARTARAVEGFIESVFLANSGNQDDPAQARDTTAHQLLDRGAERVDRELADAPEARLHLYRAMYDMYTHMALNERAVSLQRRSLALATQLYGPDVEATLRVSADLARSLIEMGQADEARGLLTRADAAASRHPPADPTLRVSIDASLAALVFNADPPQAYDWARRAAAGVQGLPASPDTIGALQMLGETANNVGRYDEAANALQAAQAQIARAPSEGQGGLPMILATLGEVQDKLGDAQAADATFERALAGAQRLGDPYTLHLVTYRVSRHQLADGLLRQAVETSAANDTWGRTAGPDFGAIPIAIGGQHAAALTAWGDPAQALRILDSRRPSWAALPPDERAPLLAERADALVALGRAGEAGDDLAQAVRIAGTHAGATALIHGVQRRWWAALGQPQRALDDLRAERGASTAPLPALRRRAEEARWAAAAGHAAEAQALATAVLADVDRSSQRPFARVAEADAAEALGRALQAQGQAGAAVAPLERALALRRPIQDPQRSPVLRQTLLALAQARTTGGDAASAAAATAEADRLRAGLAGQATAVAAAH